jgi:FkbM family methyltransferase
MYRFLQTCAWRAQMLVSGKIPRLFSLLRNRGLEGLAEAIYFKLRHPLRCAGKGQKIFRLVDNVNGFRMLVDASDRGIGRELNLFAVHEPLATALLGGFVREGDRVLDIGANIGYYTLLLSRLVGVRGTVVAVEPHPENFRLLRRNLTLNRVGNVKLLQAAVADHRGQASLVVSRASNWHTLVENSDPQAVTITVPTVTVDELRDEFGAGFSLLRMDTEGYEGHILEGAKHTLEVDRPVLTIEVHPAFLGPIEGTKFLTRLLDAGYESCFLILRSEDCPWRKARQVVREIPLNRLMLETRLLRTREAFTLFLQPVERASAAEDLLFHRSAQVHGGHSAGIGHELAA